MPAINAALTVVAFAQLDARELRDGIRGVRLLERTCQPRIFRHHLLCSNRAAQGDLIRQVECGAGARHGGP